MTRWTVYDSKTGETVGVHAAPDDEVVENPSSADALSSAISDPAAVAVLPARDAASALVLTMRRSQDALQYQPTGFLGVHDQLFLDPDPAKKKWWRKILG